MTAGTPNVTIRLQGDYHQRFYKTFCPIGQFSFFLEPRFESYLIMPGLTNRPRQRVQVVLAVIYISLSIPTIVAKICRFICFKITV